MSETPLDADRARRELYDIMKRDAPFEEKVERALELGKSYLRVENGHVTRIDPKTDYWEAIASTDAPDGEFPPGLALDFDTTYCRRVVEGGSSVALHDATEQGWEDDPAFDAHGLHCYHGTTLTVDDELYGTVCFVSEEPRDEPFTDGDTMFAELVARLLEHELERRRYDVELTRRSNLINVLNRVLRHNLRNSMAVIRGRTDMIATEFPDAAPHTETVIDRADRIIALSEKARKLETIIVNEFDRQDIDLRTVLDRVVGNVLAEHPAASITVDGAEDVTLSVQPSLETALHELLENAAKHAGDEPIITVSVEPVPNAVEIHVVDDGPGLNDIEKRVLTDGVETPLSHGLGLGLWLAYWVVTSHDGTIDATSSPNGTRMTIRVPRDRSTPTPGDDESDETRTLQRVQDKFRAVFDEAFDAMVTIDDEGVVIDANRSAADLLGAETTDLLGHAIGEYSTGGSAFDAAWQDSYTTDHEQGTVAVDAGEGEGEDEDEDRIVEYAVTSNIIPGQHLVVMRDVTERERRKRERKLAETVFRNTQDAIFLIDVTEDAEFRVERVNEVYERLTGLSNADVQGKTPREIVGEEDGAEIEARYRQCVERGETIEYPETIPVDGEERHWETKLSPVVEDGTVVKLVGAMRDVTDRERRKRELELKTQAMDDAPIGITLADATRPDDPLVYANDAFQRLTGYDEDEVLGHNCRFLQGERTDPATVATIREAIEADRPVATELRNYRKDGTEFWNELTVAPVTNDDGEVTHYLGFQQDRTDRRERQRELTRTKQALETLLPNVPVVLWQTDENGVFTQSRGAALAKLGLEPDEVVGDSVFDVFAGHPEIPDYATRALDGERVSATITIGEAVFDIWWQPLDAEAGEPGGTIGLGHDVTERARQLRVDAE